MLASIRPRDVAGKTRRRIAADELAELIAVGAKIKKATAELKTIVLARGSQLMNIHGVGPGSWPQAARPGREDPVRLRFTADPGPGLVAGISDLGDRFRLTVNEIDVVDPDEALPNLPVACAVWKPRPSLVTSAEAWLMAGAPHHTVLSTVVGVEVLEDFSEMTATEMLLIDEDTTSRALQRELRWSAAYHRLAQGL